jgi:pseudaminic acid synthase
MMEHFRKRLNASPDSTMFDLIKMTELPWDMHDPIVAYCRKKSIPFLSTPFEEEAVDLLESYNVPAYKIASFEIVDIPLLRKIACTGKPIIMSTGMATQAEIDEAVQTIVNAGNEKLALLKCTTAYPAPYEEMNLKTIPDMAKRYGLPVGVSDHSLGFEIAIAAVALGACIIEKHFTLSKDLGGPDASFSAEPGEFASMVNAVRNVEKALGCVSYEPSEKELISRSYRRSLFAIENIEKGNIFTRENIRSIRPANGLHPRYLSEILGKKAAQNITRGTPLTRDMIVGWRPK